MHFLQLVFLEHKFLGEWRLCIRIPVYAAAAVCELQTEIRGAYAMASIYV